MPKLVKPKRDTEPKSLSGAIYILSPKNIPAALKRMISEERWNLQIAKAVYELRQMAGLSIQDVAKRAGIPVCTVQRLEDADPRWVSLSQLWRVARAIGGRVKIESDYERLKQRQRKVSRKATKEFWEDERGDR